MSSRTATATATTQAFQLIQTALAAAEPQDNDIESAVQRACQPFFSDHSLGLDIEDLEVDVDRKTLTLGLSTRFSANDNEDGTVRARFEYETGALTLIVVDEYVVRNKKMPFPDANTWASMIKIVLTFLERLLVTERVKIDTLLKGIEDEFKSGMSKLFKTPVRKAPLHMFVTWRPAGDMEQQ